MEKDFMTLEEYELTTEQRFFLDSLKALIAAIDRLTEAIKKK